jgi:TRAP-type uncharacterized transport system substrate-binding protein
VLRAEAARRSLAIELRTMAGSEQALLDLRSGRVDVALVQGGLNMADHPGLRQVAVPHIEPLHLLVKAEIYRAVARNLAGLRGKVVNVGEHGSGTYLLATEVMALSGLRAGIDYTATTHPYAELERETDLTRLPDAVFSVSTLPLPIARHLVSEHHYRLMALPFRDAFALGLLDLDHGPPDASGERPARIDRRHVYDTTIPAFAYEIEPGVPPEVIHTLGTRLLLVARYEIAPVTIRRLLEVVFNSPFCQALEPPLDVKLLESPPELPWHDAHASDARDFVMRLILHQRDDLEERDRAQRRPAEALWNEAVSGTNHPATDTQTF